MMIWFTSDLHLGHTRILEHQPARAAAFGGIHSMDGALIDSINSVVKPDDELWHLGDFCWKASQAAKYRQQIKCRTIFSVVGNHDSSSLSRCFSGSWDIRVKTFRVEDSEYRFHLCHYPMLSWSAMHHGSFHLYGHSHGTYEDKLDLILPGRRSMDVGIDAIYNKLGLWRPVSLEEVINLLTGKPWEL